MRQTALGCRARRGAALGVHRNGGMGVLFISHSSQNNDAAHRVRDWLKGEGYTEVFLDLEGAAVDQAPGQAWRDELKRLGERCAAVVVLVSPAWVESEACQRNLRMAIELGKQIVTVQIAPVDGNALPSEARTHEVELQLDGALEERRGFADLKEALRRLALRPTDFPWPPADEPERAPYRGLNTLEERDAAIFFGRDAELTKGLDALRRMRNGQKERVLAVLGRSGAGKSTFLRAGLLARLRRLNEDFVVLPLVIPTKDPFRGPTGLWAALGLNEEPSSDDELKERLTGIQDTATVDSANAERPPPTLVLPIDPADDFLAVDGTVAFLRRCLAVFPNLLILVTVSDDRLARLDGFDREPSVGVFEFRLPAMSLSAFGEMIAGPGAAVAPPIAVHADLTTQFAADLGQADALPLLAFTLERLVESKGRKGQIDLSDYQRGLGGISGAINAAVTSAYEKALRDPSCPTNRTALDALARSAFIPWLVEIDDPDAPPKRRVVPFERLPQPTHSLVGHLLSQRLLATSSHEGVTCVEVAHEAVLRNWWGLAGWIREERLILERLHRVKQAAEEWEIDERSRELLVHRGELLESAEALLKRPDLAQELAGTPLEYLDACRASEIQQHERQIRRQRRQRILRRLGTVAVLAVAVLGAVGLAYAYQRLQAAERSLSMLLTVESRRALDAGHRERAMRLAVLAASDTVLSPAVEGAQFQLGRAALMSRDPIVFAMDEGPLTAARLSADGNSALTASADGSIRVWKREASRRWSSDRLPRDHAGPVLAASWSPAADLIATGGADAQARAWSRSGGGWSSVILDGHRGAVHVAEVSSDGTRIATAARGSAIVNVWQRSEAGGWTSEKLQAGHGGVHSVLFSGDGSRLVIRGTSGELSLWAPTSDDSWRRTDIGEPDAAVSAVAFSQDGLRVVTGSIDGIVRVWRPRPPDGWTTEALIRHGSPISAVALAPGGTRIASADDDGGVKVWRRTTGGSWRATDLVGHTGRVSDAGFSLDGGRLWTAGDDGSARVWRPIAKGETWASTPLGGHDGAVRWVSIASNDKVLTGSVDGTARLWSLEEPAAMTLGEHADLVEVIAPAPDGGFFVTGARDGAAKVWQKDGTFHELKGHTDAIVDISVSSNGHRIATASQDHTARVWVGRAAGLWQDETLEGHTAPLTAVAFSPDDTAVLTASEDQTARVWRRSTTGAWTAEELAGHGAAVSAALFSPNGQQVVTVTIQAQARLWTRVQNTWKATLLDGRIVTAAFTPVGLLTGGQHVRLWRLGSGAPTFEQLVRPQAGGQAVLVSAAADGTALLAATEAGQIWLWARSAQGRWQPQRLDGHRGAVTAIDFFASGRRFLTVTTEGGGTVRVWGSDASGLWSSYRLSEAAVTAAAVASGGLEVVTAAKAWAGDRPVVKRWTLDWLRSDSERQVGADVPSLVATICAGRMSQVVVDKATSPAQEARPRAQLTTADLSAAPIIRVAGLSAGDDVCRASTADILDQKLSQLVPRAWWSALAVPSAQAEP